MGEGEGEGVGEGEGEGEGEGVGEGGSMLLCGVFLSRRHIRGTNCNSKTYRIHVSIYIQYCSLGCQVILEAEGFQGVSSIKIPQAVFLLVDTDRVATNVYFAKCFLDSLSCRQIRFDTN